MFASGVISDFGKSILETHISRIYTFDKLSSRIGKCQEKMAPLVKSMTDDYELRGYITRLVKCARLIK